MKPIPVLYNRKEECCGCTACYSICPQKAIAMKSDEEGFDYPVIDEAKCVRCEMCLNVCSIKAAQRKSLADIGLYRDRRSVKQIIKKNGSM